MAHQDRHNRHSRPLLLAIRHVLAFPVWLYQKLVSPAVPSRCIYHPSCSSYTHRAIIKHGLALGIILGIGRVTRCIGGVFVGGEDPVPEKFSFAEIGKNYRHFRHRRARNTRE